MTITAPIPPHLMERLENFTLECSGLENYEVIFPPRDLLHECLEVLQLSPSFTPATHLVSGPIYINIKNETITGVVRPKFRRLKNAP